MVQPTLEAHPENSLSVIRNVSACSLAVIFSTAA